MSAVPQTAIATQGRMRLLLRAMRPANWAKNLLVITPALMAHRSFDAHTVGIESTGLVVFCFAASAIYLANDLLDLRFDRQHPWKCRRPFASGALPIAWGLGASTGLTLAALAISEYAFGTKAALLVLFYLGSSLIYSRYLKNVAVLDVLVLTSFYGQRVVFGGQVARVPLSNWFLMFFLFFFFSLAMAKRCAELLEAGTVADEARLGRAYRSSDYPVLSTMGIASALLSLLVVALYLQSPEIARLYLHPRAVWGVVPVLLLWLGRIWLAVSRGAIREDPISYGLKDRVTLLSALSLLAIVLLAAR